jgi:hypothetical protein
VKESEYINRIEVALDHALCDCLVNVVLDFRVSISKELGTH